MLRPIAFPALPGLVVQQTLFERLCCGSVDCAVKGTTAARTGRHRKKMGEKVYLDSEAIEKLILERYKSWRCPPRQEYLQLSYPARVTLLPLSLAHPAPPHCLCSVTRSCLTLTLAQD